MTMRLAPQMIAAAMCMFGIALPSTAAAQERKGFWFTVGAGPGSVGISAGNDAAGNIFTGGRDAGLSSEISLGWAMNRQLLVGVEIKGISGTLVGSAEGQLIVTNLSGTLLYYPNPSANFFVRGGAGGSFLELTNDAPVTEDPVATGAGFGLSVGAGYDIYLGRGFSLTPAVGFWYGRPGDLRRAGQTLLRNWTHNVIDVTFSVKFN